MAIARRLGVLLLAGLALSLVVAWGSAFLFTATTVTRTQSPPMDMEPLTGDDLVGIDPIVPIMCLAEAPGARALSCQGGRFKSPRFGLDRDFIADDWARWNDPAAYDFAEARGWPFLCVWYGERYSPEAGPLRICGGVVIGRRRDAARSNMGSDTMVLPYRPLAAGLVLNTLIYGAALFCAMQIPVRLRRRRPGRCASCGYSLAGLGVASRCPECGSSLQSP